MCGPADFQALSTCVTHLAELSTVGLTTYVVCKTTSFCRELDTERREREENASQNMPGQVVAEASNGRPDA